jgi:hypothetical protein
MPDDFLGHLLDVRRLLLRFTDGHTAQLRGDAGALPGTIIQHEPAGLPTP